MIQFGNHRPNWIRCALSAFLSIVTASFTLAAEVNKNIAALASPDITIPPMARHRTTPEFSFPTISGQRNWRGWRSNLSAARFAAASGRWKLCSMRRGALPFSRKPSCHRRAPHRIRQSRNHHRREQSFAHSGVRHVLLPPRRMEALLHVVRSSSSSPLIRTQ